MTKSIKDEDRIDAIQSTAAQDIAKGRSLDFVASKIQLMSHAQRDAMTQSLISFGGSFEASMEKAADYIAQSITIINDQINAIKSVRNISKKGTVMEKEGISAGLSSNPAECLQQLQLLKAMHEKCGLYENIRIRALTWDGSSKPNPIGDHRAQMEAERASAEREAQQLQEEADRKAIHNQAPQLSFSVTAQDKNGNTLSPDTYLTKKDGNIDWLYLKRGKQWKPIRLCVGEDSSPHKGYGLTHIVASRSLDDPSFWHNMSPEAYIENICANASELYEMGNRELIVKGKRPSQWMFIQLVDNGSFYSIVTAHPVKQNKKPVGKRVPLRSEPASSVDVDQNSFPDNNANDATPQSANAAWNSEPNLPNDSEIVNIKDVTCTFDDGSIMKASFSIAPQDNEQWKNSLNHYLANGATDRAMPIKMSSAPNVLQALGFSNMDIVITLDKIMGAKHSLDQTHVEQLAAAIHDPIMVVDSATQAEAVVVLTEVKVNGVNVIAAIHLDKQERGGFYHVVASAYNKKSPWMFMDQIKNGHLRYIDKKRALAWARENRLQLPALSSQKGKPTILTPEDVVKWKNTQSENNTSFSLSSMRDIVSSLSKPSMQATRATELVKDFNQAAENWNRVMAGKEPTARMGAELLGTINSLISSARYILPEGYRSNIRMQMQWASIYASMAENGTLPLKGSLQGGTEFYEKFKTAIMNQTSIAVTEAEAADMIAEIGTQRLDQVMGKVIDKIRDQLLTFAKDEMWNKTMKRVNAAYPKQTKGKKSPKGKMETEAYRKLEAYRAMLTADPETKSDAMISLEAKYSKETEEDKLETIETDIIAWKCYGNYQGMSIQQAQLAMLSLTEYLATNRNTWESHLQQEKGRIKYQARRMAAMLPDNNTASDRAKAKINHQTKTLKQALGTRYDSLSYSQLMQALEPIFGKEFTHTRIAEIALANTGILNASHDRNAWLYHTISSITGKNTESACEQWLADFDKIHNTQIKLKPNINISVSLTPHEAHEWANMTAQQREAKRTTLRHDEDKQEMILNNIPTEEMIPHIINTLANRKPHSKGNITITTKTPNKSEAGTLECSRDTALYAILLHEQTDYADRYNKETGELEREGLLKREGLNDEDIKKLYEYVGTEGLAYGYALRRRLNEQGISLAKVYEARMGLPFTLKDNYFRASFDRNSTKEKDTLQSPQNGQIGGGKYGMTIERITHNENADWSKSASLVFLAASAEQDNYIYSSHITTFWRSLLMDKTLEQKLKQKLGDDVMGKLTSFIDLIDGATLENNRAFLNLSRLQSKLQKAFAYSVLAGNGFVILKQASAIMHGFIGGYIPSDIIEKTNGTKTLAHKHIGMVDFLYHYTRAKTGLGEISQAELRQSPYFTARKQSTGTTLAQIGNQLPGENYSKLEKPAEKAMNLIEWVDVEANLQSMHALANAYYTAAKKLNEKNGKPFTEEQLKQHALQQIGITLETTAQPLTKTQKAISQAGGGLLSKLAFMMRTESMNKLGAIISLWQSGHQARATQSWLTLGVANSMLCWLIDWIRGDDDDIEKKLKKYGATTLLGPLGAAPIIGEGLNFLASKITGERFFADSYSRSLIDIGGAYNATEKEYTHFFGKKQMKWNEHFTNMTKLLRITGAGGAWSRSTNATLSSFGALSLSAATGANISRTSKDILTKFYTKEKNHKKRN